MIRDLISRFFVEGYKFSIGSDYGLSSHNNSTDNTTIIEQTLISYMSSKAETFGAESECCVKLLFHNFVGFINGHFQRLPACMRNG
jgi:hypothetical protein